MRKLGIANILVELGPADIRVRLGIANICRWFYSLWSRPGTASIVRVLGAFVMLVLDRRKRTIVSSGGEVDVRKWVDL